MRIDTSTALKMLDGKTIVEYPTVGHALLAALLSAPEPGKTYSAVEQVQRYQLARKIAVMEDSADLEIDLTAEQAAMLKADIARTFAPIVAGQVLPMLDG